MSTMKDEEIVLFVEQSLGILGRIEQKYWDAAREIARRKGLKNHRPIYEAMLQEWGRRAKSRADRQCT